MLLLAVSLVDVNLFSLNAMYANRLVRCYLGASRRKQVWKDRWGRDGQGWVRSTGGAPTGVDRRARERNENLVTGFDLNDDIPLYDLRFIKDLGQGRLNKRVVSYDGPYPLFNTTLNLVAGQELALKDRKGDSFVLSPWYCGSQTTGYQPLPDPAADPDPDLTLGRAVAVSGAAADPNMSAARSLAETMLMTVFNARLGCWLQNPSRVGGIKGQLLRWLEARDSIGTGLQAPGLAWLRSKLREQVKGETWRARGPSTGGLLLREFLGLTDESSAYVHLSDGGHFENLAVYELVRRRCRFIVACDAGQDGGFLFEDLAGLIAKVPDRLRCTDRARHQPAEASGDQPVEPLALRCRDDPLRGRRAGHPLRGAGLYQGVDDRRRAARHPELRDAQSRIPPPDDCRPVLRRTAVRELPGPGRSHRPRSLLRGTLAPQGRRRHRRRAKLARRKPVFWRRHIRSQRSRVIPFTDWGRTAETSLTRARCLEGHGSWRTA